MITTLMRLFNDILTTKGIVAQSAVEAVSETDLHYKSYVTDVFGIRYEVTIKPVGRLNTEYGTDIAHYDECNIKKAIQDRAVHTLTRG